MDEYTCEGYEDPPHDATIEQVHDDVFLPVADVAVLTALQQFLSQNSCKIWIILWLKDFINWMGHLDWKIEFYVVATSRKEKERETHKE